MNPEECRGVVTFLRHAGALKKEKRRGWVDKVKIANPESVADHSWRTALLALVMGSYRGLDTGRMMGMALLHDLSEAVTGDLTPMEVGRAEKRGREEEAMRSLLSNLPSPMLEVLTGLWEEYREGASREAELVRELDKVEMALQADEYRREGYDAQLLNEFQVHAERLVEDRALVDLLDSLKTLSSS